jgi:hypothetical protein
MSAFAFSRPPPSPPVYQVPHDRIGLRLVTVVHRAVARAFEIIRHEGFPLATAGENQITRQLETTLENRIRNRGEIESFDSTFFGPVGRGSEVVNFNETKISKKPDLIFRLRREDRTDWDQTQDALFAECKPVDQTHKLKDHYCAIGKDCTGIERFIIGNYAWAMQEAFMIAYVRGGLKIMRDLAPELMNTVRHHKLGSPTTPESVESSPFNEFTDLLHRTIHQRLFPWKQHETQAGPVEIFHSWHCCD